MASTDIDKFAPAEHRDLVLDFFWVFSRFEYALKRAGFVTDLRGRVEVKWNAFSSMYRPNFDVSQTPELLEAYNYFNTNPPRKQILKADSLAWSEPQEQGNKPALTWLCDIVLVIRNNLFHGGKFPLLPIKDPARNPTLLRHSITVIRACVQLDDKVNRHFFDD